MTKERTAPQSPEDMAKAAQEAAVKAAMEQAQSMFGSIPGFQMPEGMQEQIMTQMTAGIPNMAELQAQQEAMLKAAGIGMETVAEAERQNMAFAQQMMQGFYIKQIRLCMRRKSVAKIIVSFTVKSWKMNRSCRR